MFRWLPGTSPSSPRTAGPRWRPAAVVWRALAAGAWAGSVQADPGPPLPALNTLPQEGYVQGARATQATAVAAGFGWRASPVECVESGWRCSWRFELELARWRPLAPATAGRSGATQLGLMPLWRQEAPRRSASQWYLEAGIGPHLVSPLYRTSGRHFSTAFNFGSQIAIGVALGEQRAHELSLRLEHFSNAGLRDPNPGENFVQLRYLVKR